MARREVEVGVVAAFDDAAGVGRILDEAGDPLEFHCVAVADGSRRIAEGTRVAFTRRVGPTGRPEALDVTPRSV